MLWYIEQFVEILGIHLHPHPIASQYSLKLSNFQFLVCSLRTKPWVNGWHEVSSVADLELKISCAPSKYSQFGNIVERIDGYSYVKFHESSWRVSW